MKYFFLIALASILCSACDVDLITYECCYSSNDCYTTNSSEDKTLYEEDGAYCTQEVD